MNCRIALLLLALLSATHAATPPSAGLHFQHHDWELACDNTRTCRAAGYHAEGDSMTLTVLLTRAAGPATAVEGQLMLGNHDDDSRIAALPPHFDARLQVGDDDLGTIRLARDDLQGTLSPAQVRALLLVLPGTGSIEVHVGALEWRLSDRGATAVLLKMDELQGRIGTRSALARPGQASDDSVHPPLPAPVLQRVSWPDNPTTDPALGIATLQRLKDALANEDDCTLEDLDPASIEVSAFDASRRLVVAPCWQGAYNHASGYWLFDDARNETVLITTTGTDFDDGRILAAHKGRGLGDCWSTDAWTWDGQHFVHTESSTTGMCRLIAAGGAWSLPQKVVEVREPSAD